MSGFSILSVTWKIKKSCQLYFSPFNTFFISIMNVQDFSLQREGRCRVCYPNAKQVVILQSGSLGCYCGPDRWATRPMRDKELPEMP